jgi:hypothetical protein
VAEGKRKDGLLQLQMIIYLLCAPGVVERSQGVLRGNAAASVEWLVVATPITCQAANDK